jgi:hypothetical protein
LFSKEVADASFPSPRTFPSSILPSLPHFPSTLLYQTGNAHTGKEFEHAPEHAHDRLDKTDERSIANTLADASRVEKKEKEAEQEKAEEKPTDAARKHGNEPSRGAKVDEKIEDEEAAIIAKMDAKKEAKNN